MAGAPILITCERCGRTTTDVDLWDPEADSGRIFCDLCWSHRNDPLTFYRTNSVDDPGHEVTEELLVNGFLSSAQRNTWEQGGGRLARYVMDYLMVSHGQPASSVNYAALVDRIVDGILERLRP